MNINEAINYAVGLHQSGRIAEAAAIYRQIVERAPDEVNALNLLGVCHLQRAEYAASLPYLERAVQLAPGFHDALSNLCVALRETGRHADALRCYDQLIARQPTNAAAHNNRANVLRALGRAEEALAGYKRATQLKQDHVEAYINRAGLQNDLDRYDEALINCDRALKLAAHDADAAYQRARALQGLGRTEEALASCDQAVALRPAMVEALNLQGTLLHELEHYERALACYDQALSLRPNWVEALCNRASACLELRRWDAARADCDHAIGHDARMAEAYAMRGAAQKALGHDDAAMADFDRALELRPDLAEVFSHKAALLMDHNRHVEAYACYTRLLELAPDMPLQYGKWLYNKLLLCDWQDLPVAYARVSQAIVADKPVSTPLVILGIPSSAEEQRRCAEIYVRENYPRAAKALWQGEAYDHARIHIGYFSADLHNHATAHLMAEFFERHDKTRFEVTAFSFGPPKEDPWRQRLVKAFDRFIDVRDLNDFQIARHARDLEIDIAVDLKGFTKDCRPGIFALRPAPVQINYLGYPGTMGADYIDYIVADPTLIPESSRRYYSEKVIYLPHTYQCNDATKAIADVVWRRADLGLPENGFVFCCLNNSRKITPDLFDIWMRLLRAVDDAVLWLYSDTPEAARNLRREAERRQVDPARLVFAGPLPLAEHLARYRYADLFLDTLYWNAHTTASDALWAGLPVLTCLGESFASRVAGSLSRAVGLPELVVESHTDYERLALHLANQREELLALRAKLDAQRLLQPLFDSALFTRHMEAAYIETWRRARAGSAPDDIYIVA
jgi:predicted O-linked N-acetylglucosamine transferase (SPINDLY family)